MKSLELPPDHFKKHFNALLKSGEQFKVIEQSSRLYIQLGADYCNYIFPKSDSQFLKLYAKVRSDALDFIEANEGLTETAISSLYGSPTFFDFAQADVIDNLQTKERGVYQIDISAAYWNLVFQMGAITLETYRYGLPLKKYRLKALGALATKQCTKIYSGGALIDTQYKRPITANIFLYCQSNIDSLIRECMARFECFGYWVDCVFTDKDNYSEIIDFFSTHNHRVKVHYGMGYYEQKEGNIYFNQSIDKEAIKSYYCGRAATFFSNKK